MQPLRRALRLFRIVDVRPRRRNSMNRILASMVLLASLAALSMAADPAAEPGQIVTPVSPAATPPQESAPASISEPPDSDSKPPATADRPVSWKLLLPNVVH